VPIASWEGFQARVPDYPCCTAVGSVSALDANTGRPIWKTYTIAQRPQPTSKNSHGVQQWGPAGVPVWNTPTVDAQRHVVYVGTGDASTYPAPPTTDSILALAMQTGKVVWSQQIYKDDSFIVGCDGAGRTDNCPKVIGPDWDIPMSPMLKRLGGSGKRLIVFGTKPGEVLALDADKRGEQVWRVNPEQESAANAIPAANGIGLRAAVWGAAVDDSDVYVGSSAGGVAAVQLADGERKWRSMLNSTTENKITHTAAVTVIPGVVFAAGTDGKLWGLATGDGHVLWSFDTARSFDTVNSVPAHGGSIVSAGPTVAGGMLFIGSGYGVVAETPGNALLAFAVME
jgi:polyvinyl alcohol dehydrogenase (cytochrome)